jgi:hypothetical protein
MKTNLIVCRNLILSFIKWFAGFFEDQHGSGSSKRIVLYAMTILLFKVSNDILSVLKSGMELSTNMYLLLVFLLSVIFILLLVLLGVIAKEFFLKYGIPLINSKTNTETNLKEETQVKTEEVTVQDPNVPTQ